MKGLNNLTVTSDQADFLLNSLPLITYYTGLDGAVKYCNKTWYDYTGLEQEEKPCNSWISVIHPDDFESSMNCWTTAQQKGEEIQVQYRLRRFDGMYRWHLNKVVPIKNENGNIICWAGTATDIHDQKMIQEELTEKNLLLKKINQELDNFIYTASHDLKAPILNIEGLIIAILDRVNKNRYKIDDIITGLTLINNAVGKFKNSILELTNIAKIQKDFTNTFDKINIGEFINEVCMEIDYLIAGSNTIINFHNPGNVSIKFSRVNLKSIFFNLISNAIKYRHDSRTPVIDIYVEKHKEFTLIRIKDNGLGIKKKDIPHLFAMSSRFHDHVEGSGIGLYLVKKILDNTDGNIVVESTLGVGSVFNLYFKN